MLPRDGLSHYHHRPGPLAVSRHAFQSSQVAGRLSGAFVHHLDKTMHRHRTSAVLEPMVLQKRDLGKRSVAFY
jgi:hypothetical protein